MMPAAFRSRVGLRVASILALALAASTIGAAPAAAADELLPDLKMGDIYSIRLEQSRAGRPRLRFGTIVWNVGDGPLEVRAAAREGDVMRDLVQRISMRGGAATTYAPPEAEAFYAGDGHDHWHIKAFITISLYARSASPEDPVVGPTVSERGLRKIGFCLTDLVRAPATLRPANAAPRIGFPVSGCGTRRSQEVRMGISPGWGDDYKPFFNHQWIDIAGLVPGTYRMCATVNSTGLWREKDDNLANNSSWLDLEISGERPSFRVVASGDTDCQKPVPVWYGVGG
jgi:hypothetical protein